MDTPHTQVAIIGAGPAGLLLSQILDRHGIDTVVLENRSREYCESRIRAGVQEQTTVDLLSEAGVGERLARQGLVHDGVYLRFKGENRRIDFPSLTGGRHVVVYGQQEVVKDLNQARIDAGAKLWFETPVDKVTGFDGDRPVIHYRTPDGESRSLSCDYVAGCDGFHGAARKSIPADRITVHQRDLPLGWLGILADVPPSSEELIYAQHEHGFALMSMRSPTVSRMYIQCRPDEDPEAWSDDRIWEELILRLSDRDQPLETGPITQKTVAPMRGFVVEPMRFGRLFLAGDAAHIVPPTGAKGMNLAVADIGVLAPALVDALKHGKMTGIDTYSPRCLDRVWKTQRFSQWFTSLTHRWPEMDRFDIRLQEAALESLTTSEAAARNFAESYVGLPDGTSPLR